MRLILHKQIVQPDPRARAFSRGQEGWNMSSTEEKKICFNRIKTRFSLSEAPIIEIVRNNLEVCEDGWSYEIDFKEGAVEPPGLYKHDSFYDNHGNSINAIELLRSEYPQLFFDSNKNLGFETCITEVRVTLGKVTTSAGFNWTIFGTIHKTNEKYCAIILVHTRPLFQRCHIASLLKIDEVDFAKSSECNFIQTWHERDNPDFYGAIYPSLKNNFFLYHGTDAGGEGYEEAKYIHLRRYLDGSSFHSKVMIDGRTKRLVSPLDNEIIRKALEKTRKKYCGRLIKEISKPVKG